MSKKLNITDREAFDVIAAMVLGGILANPNTDHDDIDGIAKKAVAVVEAVMAELAKPRGDEA